MLDRTIRAMSAARSVQSVTETAIEIFSGEHTHQVSDEAFNSVADVLDLN